MEFKEAMRVWRRMCEDYEAAECKTCPFDEAYGGFCREFALTSPSKAEAILVKWAEEHPEKTIADDFFEKHPKALRGTGRMKDTPLTCAYQCGYGRSRDDMCGTSYCAECWRRPLEVAHND